MQKISGLKDVMSNATHRFGVDLGRNTVLTESAPPWSFPRGLFSTTRPNLAELRKKEAGTKPQIRTLREP